MCFTRWLGYDKEKKPEVVYEGPDLLNVMYSAVIYFKTRRDKVCFAW